MVNSSRAIMQYSQANPFKLYLDSASRGNAFAPTRLGSLICEESDFSSSPGLLQRAAKLLDHFQNDLHSLVHTDQASSNLNLAKKALVRGGITMQPAGTSSPRR
jgi:hypothetical protein